MSKGLSLTLVVLFTTVNSLANQVPEKTMTYEAYLHSLNQREQLLNNLALANNAA